MVEPPPVFGEVEAYERFMGRWSRAAAGPFLEWLQAAPGGRWLDVGSGTGILSGAVLGAGAPATIVGIDPTPAQVAHAARHLGDRRARFGVADARALPFADASFDVVAAGLVLNFVPEPRAAVAEMRRVVRPAGIVAAYVWDFEPELSPSGPLRKALKVQGIDVPALPGIRTSTLTGLASLFDQARLVNIVTTTIEVTVGFTDFQDFWQSQTTRYSPTTGIIDALDPRQREALAAALKSLVRPQGNGTVRYAARANAVKGEAEGHPPRAAG
jgi:ubiquinone/menaquinone biosynthesis C-methylase UbiE